MSDFNKWETRLTPHALLRLGERTSMTPDILCDILDNNKNMNLNMKNSYFSKSYGNKVRTLSLILENKKTKNFNNNLKIRFTK